MASRKILKRKIHKQRKKP
jgi:hypothetical protein